MWVLSAFCTLSATALAGFLWVRGQREAVQEQLQTAGAALVSLGISDFSELQDFDQFDQFIEDTLQMEKINKIIQVYDQSRKLVFSTIGTGMEDLKVLPENVIKKPSFETVLSKQTVYQSLVIPYEVKNKKATYYLQLMIPLPRVTVILKNLWWESLLLMSFLMILSLFLSRYLARRLLRPVQDIANYLDGMDPEQIQNWEPMTTGEKGEYLGAIRLGINTLMEKTQSSVAQIQKMSRYVAHEMRTPLTILQGEAENVLSRQGSTSEDYKKVLHSSLEEIQRMSEIVTTVLQVGKIQDSILRYQPSSFDLQTWVEQNNKHWEELLNRPIQLKMPQDGCRVHGDPKLLYRLVDNLVRNIRDHTAPNTRCTLILEKTNQGTSLSVEDNGGGLSPKALESLNQVGRYSEAAGVGLNLCFAIAEMCGNKLHFLPAEGQGLRVEIWMS